MMFLDFIQKRDQQASWGVKLKMINIESNTCLRKALMNSDHYCY